MPIAILVFNFSKFSLIQISCFGAVKLTKTISGSTAFIAAIILSFSYLSNFAAKGGQYTPLILIDG